MEEPRTAAIGPLIKADSLAPTLGRQGKESYIRQLIESHKRECEPAI